MSTTASSINPEDILNHSTIIFQHITSSPFAGSFSLDFIWRRTPPSGFPYVRLLLNLNPFGSLHLPSSPSSALTQVSSKAFTAWLLLSHEHHSAFLLPSTISLRVLNFPLPSFGFIPCDPPNLTVCPRQPALHV